MPCLALHYCVLSNQELRDLDERGQFWGVQYRIIKAIALSVYTKHCEKSNHNTFGEFAVEFLVKQSNTEV
jgi:hypothetical protein